ncbi:MAG TPA: hypothetical protein DDY78_17480 [Planctomycetales bacterium]|jgi:hypothetical protein|nr:hypothetical protein [Planctomycetales bacterium]
MPEPETELLRQAASWLETFADRTLDVEKLRRLTEERDVDFATAVLYQALRTSPRHGPFIAQVDGLEVGPTATGVEVVIVPGAFYREAPDSGADGRLIRETAERLGFTTALVPLLSFGRIHANADLLADWLRRDNGCDRILVTHSKSALEVRALLARLDAPELLRRVVAWVDLAGLFHGTPLVGWQRSRPIRWPLTRLLLWWKGYAVAALSDIDRAACPPWPEALARASHLKVIHVVGLPLRRHLALPLSRRCHRRLAPLGPNDGASLLGDVLALPGLIYPVWGADHFLRPAGRDMGELVARILTYLTVQPAALVDAERQLLT